MSLLISSTNNQHAARALGISEERVKQMEEVVKNIMAKNKKICYTQIGELVSHYLDLNENEVFFIGIVIGSIAQFEFMVGGTIQVEESMLRSANIGDSPTYVDPSLN